MIVTLYLIVSGALMGGALVAFHRAVDPAWRGAIAYRKHRNRMLWLTLVLLVLGQATAFEAGVRAFGC